MAPSIWQAILRRLSRSMLRVGAASLSTRTVLVRSQHKLLPGELKARMSP